MRANILRAVDSAQKSQDMPGSVMLRG